MNPANPRIDRMGMGMTGAANRAFTFKEELMNMNMIVMINTLPKFEMTKTALKIPARRGTPILTTSALGVFSTILALMPLTGESAR